MEIILKHKQDDKIIEMIFIGVFLFGILDLFLILGMQGIQTIKKTQTSGPYTAVAPVLPARTAIPPKKEKKLPGIRDRYKFELKYDEVLSPATGMYTLAVCCPDGYLKDYYTYKMPWEFLLYEFAPGTPTITVFQLDENSKKGRFEIVLLDKKVEVTKIKQSEILHFIKKVSDYMPGYSWEGDLRVDVQ